MSREDWDEDWIEGPDGKPVAFHDIGEDMYPFTATAYAPDGSVVWEITMDGPGAMEVPGTGPGSVVRVEIRYGDGSVVSSTSDA